MHEMLIKNVNSFALQSVPKLPRMGGASLIQWLWDYKVIECLAQFLTKPLRRFYRVGLESSLCSIVGGSC